MDAQDQWQTHAAQVALCLATEDNEPLADWCETYPTVAIRIAQLVTRIHPEGDDATRGRCVMRALQHGKQLDPITLLGFVNALEGYLL